MKRRIDVRAVNLSDGTVHRKIDLREIPINSPTFAKTTGISSLFPLRAITLHSYSKPFDRVSHYSSHIRFIPTAEWKKTNTFLLA